jgi:hypothetical protein
MYLKEADELFLLRNFVESTVTFLDINESVGQFYDSYVQDGFITENLPWRY